MISKNTFMSKTQDSDFNFLVTGFVQNKGVLRLNRC